ncbi:MAG: aldehyde dehydrogenase family protein, partial [Anaerolineales bacterium]
MDDKLKLYNFINGEWKASSATDWLDVHNPATGNVLQHVPLSPAQEVDQAVQAAQQAFQSWRRVPPTERIQYLFELKDLLEYNFDDLSRMIVEENGKTLKEAQVEMRRAIENVE